MHIEQTEVEHRKFEERIIIEQPFKVNELWHQQCNVNRVTPN